MLLIPATIQVVHAFENHEENIVYSLDQENHFEAEDDCTLCDFIIDSSGLLESYPYNAFAQVETYELVCSYNFHKNYQPLQQTLRGPPSL